MSEPPEERPARWLPPGQDLTGGQQYPEQGQDVTGHGQGYQQQVEHPYSSHPYAAPSRVRPGSLAQPPQTGSHNRKAAIVVGGLIVVVVVVLRVIGAVTSDRDPGSEVDPGSGPTRPSPAAVPERPMKVSWKLQPTTLRPDLPGAQFIGAIDGDFSGPRVAGEKLPDDGDLWLVLTGDKDERRMILHAVDPDTGQVRWQRPMEGGLCATGSGEAGIVCASTLERDQKSGAGRRWLLQTLDPKTGAVERSVERNGWFSALHRSGDTVVALEQREPAPHAVLRGFDAQTLKQRWIDDLSDEPGHDEMFSTNKVINRKLPDREQVLDRPRFRDVGPDAEKGTDGGSDQATGLVALWAGTRTAFVQPDSGKLVMMPHCSRLVDDGKRLWCNEVAGAASYSYRGKLLHRVKGPRLAFPGDDGVGRDRNRPVFIDEGGAPTQVDLESGKVGGAYAAPGAGSAWGMKTTPETESVGRYTFLIGEAGAMLVDPKKDKIIWNNEDITISDTPILRGHEVLLGNNRWDVLDVRTGEPRATVKSEGLYMVAIGDRIAGVGPDEICLQRL